MLKRLIAFDECERLESGAKTSGNPGWRD